MPLANEEILKPGTMLLGYHILGFVGEGRWGYVYKAKHPNLPMIVAIKQLKPRGAEDEDALQRFLHEADIVAQLNHPNIVKIFDLRQDLGTDTYYIITEFAEKGTLADRLRELPEGLPIDEVLQLTMGICDGLEAVHHRGIVHRDIKPSNILLCGLADGKDIPKLSDFGIAGGPISTGTAIPPGSSVHGSVPYMSPEQVDGSEVDRRSDLYSLGITLYELLTGRVPFTGGVQDVFNMHMFVLPRSPKELRVDIPETLEQIVMRALRKDCNDRYECAADMREAIEAIRDIEIRKQRQRRFEALFERCLAALQKEEWETATQLLKQADILEPGNERVQAGLQEAEEHQRLKRLCERARQCIEVEDWEEARECLSEILNIDPSYGGGYAEKQLEQVQHELGQKRIYSDSMIHYRVGMGYFRKWQWTEVVIELEQVITHIPEFKDVSSRLVEAREYLRAEQLIEQARLCREQGEWEAAVDLLEEAARLKPPHIDVSKELENTRAERAKVRAEQRLDAWYKEGIAQLEAENLNQAKESFKKIRERQPDYRDVDNQIEEIEKKLKVKQFFEQGSQHEDSDEWEQAIDTYRKILDIESLNEEAGRRLSRAMRHVARRGQQGIYHRVTATIRNWWNSQKDRTRMGLLATFGVIILALCVGTVLVAGMPPFPPSPMPTATLQTSYVIGKTTFIVNRIPVEDIIKPLIVDTHQVDIEIEVRDTKGNLFSSNQVICQWSFDPAPQVETLGDKGECNKSYQMPEGADSQLVKVVVQGRNGGQIRGASTKSIEIVVQGKGAANE